MNERMSDLLDRAADDRGAPLSFGAAEIVRRARTRQRRRHGALAVGMAAAVAGVVGATQLLGASGSQDTGPSNSTTTASPTTPALNPQDRAIVERCSRAPLPPPPTKGADPNPETSTSRGQVLAPTASHRTAGFLRGWTLDAHVADAQGVTATFVNPDHTRWASCQIAKGGSDLGDEVDPMGRVPTGPIPQSWFGPDGFRHQATGPAWAQVCSPGEGKVCAHELFAGAFARYAGVASVRVDAPDGTVVKPVLGRYTYVFRHEERRVDPHRASNDMQPLPSMPVTLFDALGRRIIRYDYFPPYVVPDTCPSNGGC